jgi:Ca2+-binding RTX toxin-like protein
MNDLRPFAALLLGTMLLLALVQASGAHSAAQGAARKPRCTIVGTPGPDLLAGTPARDVICGLGGGDVIDAGPGNDIIRGGPGNDKLVGGPGRDSIEGGAGNDVILAWDGQRDFVDGGPGRDRAWVDRTLDRVRAVEIR